MFGRITSADDGSAFKIGPAAGVRNSKNSGSANVLVDSGASGHVLKGGLIPGLRCKFANYQALGTPRKVTTTRGHRSDGVR